MRSMTSYLLLCFMVMFWLFRLVVAFTTSIGVEIGFTPMNMNMEIIILFVTLLAIAFVCYFGVDLYQIITGIMAGSTTLTNYSNAFASFIGVVLPIVVFFNMLMDKNRTNHPVDKKTDWFYKNDEYDRKLDERADKNEYRNY